MNFCEEFVEKLTLYIDQELTEEEKIRVTEHLEVCDKCRQEYEETLDMLESLKNLEEVDLPIGFHQEVMIKINKSNKQLNFRKILKARADKEFDSRKRFRGVVASAAGVTATIFIMAVVGNIISGGYEESGYDMASFSNESAMPKMAQSISGETTEGMGDVILIPEPVESALDTAPAARQEAITENVWQDIFVKHYNVTIEVTDFEYAMEIVETLPGYSESSSTNIYGYMEQKTGYTTRRTQVADYEYAKSVLKTLGKVISENETTDKVSADVLNWRVSEQVKQEEIDRLFTMLEKSDSLPVMTAVVNRLEGATRELDDIRSQILQYNSNAEMPYLNIEIVNRSTDGQAEEEETFMEKIGTSFTESINFSMGIASGFAIFISAVFFPLLLVLILVAVVLSTLRRFKGGRKHE